MRVGGYDIVIATAWTHVQRDRIRHFLYSAWPEGIYEDAVGDYRAPLAIALRDAPATDEFFVYRDRSALDLWDQGSTPEAEETMIHVIGSSDKITIVVGSQDGPGAVLVDRIRSVLCLH